MPKATFHNLPEPKRRRLIEAALEEFAAQPYANASLDRVAAGADVSKGSLYQYFEDKADLYQHLVMTELAARRTAAVVPAAASGTFFERLEAMMLAGLSTFRADPRAASLGVRIYENVSEPVTRAISEQARARGAAFFRQQLAAAVERGEVRADIDLDIAARLVATLAGPGIIEALTHKLGLTLTEIARATTPIDERAVHATVRAAIDMMAAGLAARGPDTVKRTRRPSVSKEKKR
jgi:AcrR family transcriptional regulator